MALTALLEAAHEASRSPLPPPLTIWHGLAGSRGVMYEEFIRVVTPEPRRFLS